MIVPADHDYDRRRFGSPGGRWAFDRESAIWAGLGAGLSGLLLDAGCGTGRVGRCLAEGNAALRIVGVDAAPDRLAAARAAGPGRFVRGNVLALPFVDASFDVVAAGRLLYRVPEPVSLLREARRVLRPGGVLLLDTILWSGRQLAARLGRERDHWRIPRRALTRLLARAGFALEREAAAFLLPPGTYRRLPGRLARALGALERAVPGALRAKRFYRCRALPAG